MQPQPQTYDMATFAGRRAHAHSVMLRVAALEQPFDIGQWAADKRDPYDCGTAACACGWIARTEEAQAQGLDLVVDFVGLRVRSRLIFGISVDIRAAIDYFGVEYSDARSLFLLSGYGGTPTALDVARRMESMGWAA